MSTYRDDLVAARSRLAQLEQELGDGERLCELERRIAERRRDLAELRRLPGTVVARLLVALAVLLAGVFDLVASFGALYGVGALGTAAGWVAAGSAVLAVVVIGLRGPHWTIGLGSLVVVGVLVFDKPFDAPIVASRSLAGGLAYQLPGALCILLAIGLFAYCVLRRRIW